MKYVAFNFHDDFEDENHVTLYTHQKRKLLFVDDDDALRPVVSTALTHKGYEVETADDGDIAIEALKRSKFDAVLLDIKMPRVGGFEVLKFIKKTFPTTKVVMLTAYADLKNALESKALGADDLSASHTIWRACWTHSTVSFVDRQRGCERRQT